MPGVDVGDGVVVVVMVVVLVAAAVDVVALVIDAGLVVVLVLEVIVVMVVPVDLLPVVENDDVAIDTGVVDSADVAVDVKVPVVTGGTYPGQAPETVTFPPILKKQCGWHEYGYTPSKRDTSKSYAAPASRLSPDEITMGLPTVHDPADCELTTLCPTTRNKYRTVSPLRTLTLAGSNLKSATVTS